LSKHLGEATALSSHQPIIFSDFDGTITQVDVTDQVLSQLAHPSWQEVEQEWVRGVIGSRECLVRQLALVNSTHQELDALIDSIPVDPDFTIFQEFTQKRKFPFYVVSDGFDYIIRRVLHRAGVNGNLANGSHLFASSLRISGNRLEPSFPHSEPPCEHGCATCKPAIMRRVANGRSPIVFIGDGHSDRHAAEFADMVFAKRQLLAYCRDRNIACHAYETFADVQAVLTPLFPARSRHAGP
jgi:2-hydroxy-3-keto-5-methylthiopentenyl-1-phosphate phosphatase